MIPQFLDERQMGAHNQRTTQIHRVPQLRRLCVALDHFPQSLGAGARVEIRTRFRNSWTKGFEIAEVLLETDGVGYRIKRLSDGEILPAVFLAQEIVSER
jgi:hypothetical protein